MRERYDVDRLRVMRGELRQWPNTGRIPISDIVDSVTSGGSVYHILTDVPEDSGLELTILIDGDTVVRFELPWIRQTGLFGKRKLTYLAGGPPIDVKVWALDDYRRAIGQGRYRILVDHAVADAHRILS